MERKVEIVYEIKEGNLWRNDKSLIIKSNIADDELIDCQLSKSLVDLLKKEASILDVDKMLLGFAEAQKRGIEENLEALDEIALKAKNSADKMHQELLKAYDDNEKKYIEIETKMDETKERFSKGINQSTKELGQSIEIAEHVSKRLMEIDNYKLEKLADSVNKIVKLAESDSDLVKLILNYKAIK